MAADLVEFKRHSGACRQRMQQWAREWAAFLARWPDCCQSCMATGQCEINEEMDGCDECIYNEKCPRCSGPFHYQHGESRCPRCGWTSFEEGLPYRPECSCQEEVCSSKHF